MLVKSVDCPKTAAVISGACMCVYIHLDEYTCQVNVSLLHMHCGCILKYVSCMFQNQYASCSERSKTGPYINWTNNCFIQFLLTCFKSCTVVGIRADQAVAQRTLRLTVTSKHHGLSPNCLVKMITAKRETEEQWLPSLLSWRQCCRGASSMQQSTPQQRRVMCKNELRCVFTYVYICYLRGLCI